MIDGELEGSSAWEKWKSVFLCEVSFYVPCHDELWFVGVLQLTLYDRIVLSQAASEVVR